MTHTNVRSAFFRHSFALDHGQVFQSAPYVSPDTHEWVIANSTLVPRADGSKPAIVHFELTVESFRREAAATSRGFDIAIVNLRNGDVIADDRFVQRDGANSTLGRPDDRRFDALRDLTGISGRLTADGKSAAYRRVKTAKHNANHWIVVASSPASAASWTSAFGATELAMIGLALLLVAFATHNLRATRVELEKAASTDALTGLANRRQLMLDVAEMFTGASASEPFTLALYDLDGFKSYNDNFGHPAGDALLARLAQSLAEAVEERGHAYRMGGDEFCVIANGEDASVLLAAARDALSDHAEGFNVGASYGSVAIPSETGDIDDALRIADQRMYAEKHSGRYSAGRQTTDVLMRMIAERDRDLGNHLDDVSKLCRTLAERLGLDADETTLLLRAAALHDVGKAAIPDAIMLKPGPLNDAEWTFMKQHTLIGERILAAAPALEAVSRLVRWSHERVDGSGYPDGLAGDEIPLGARIIAVCDAYDAMTSSRSYRPTPMTPDMAIAELRASAGTQFDVRVVEALADVIAEGESVQRSAGRIASGQTGG